MKALNLAGILAAILTCGFGATERPDDRHFGTDAFVPDWRAAEEADAKATARFLQDYWPQLKGDFDKGGTGLPENLPAAQKSAGAAVFTVPYVQKILPDFLPQDEQLRFTSVRLFAAQGESEPFALGVRTLDQSKDVSVEVGDLSSAGRTFSKLDISSRLSLPYRGAKAGSAVKPMVLIRPPGNVWTFPPNTSLVYLVDIHVPLKTAPGIYKGRVVVKAGSAVARDVDLELEVLPFALKTNNFRAGGFGTCYRLWAGGFSGYYPEMVEIDARYGFNLAGGFFNKGSEIPFRKAADGTLEVDDTHEKFRKFQATVALLKKYGMGQVAFWNWGASGDVRQFNGVLQAAGVPGIETDEGKRGFAQICRAIKAAEKKHGWPELVINPFDEALMDQDATRQVIQAMPLVRAASPETRLYMTEWHEGYTRLYQSDGSTLSGRRRPPDNAKAGPQVFNFHVIGANTLSEAGRKIQEELGGEYWTYTAITDVGPQARFTYGFMSYIVKAQTCLIWATWKGDLTGAGWTLHYQMPDRPGDPNDTRGLALPSSRAPLAREGIDDRKYIETLRFHARARKSADDLKFLDELPARCRAMAADLKGVGGVANVEAKVANADSFQKLRVELKDRILKLVK